MTANRRGVRVTLYLPDELRARAKAANLNLSRILRDGVERELRGEAAGPTVTIDRDRDTVQIHVSVPAGLLDV